MFRFKFNSITQITLLTFSVLFVTGCATAPPQNPNNLCSIFKEKPGWHKSALSAEKKWGVPVHVPMSIIYQESSFKHDARPPKKYILGFIPNGRESTALGYSQALDGTWREYQRSTGNYGSRTSFHDSMDFIGWYVSKTHRINKVSKWDAYAQYLNYHEGQGGYKKRTYAKKPWLVQVAKKVDRRSKTYSKQYASCKKSLSRGGWFW